MAVNKISMAINYRKNKGTLNSNGKYYAEVDRQKTLSTRGLAQHLKDHNCMVGRDAIMAVLIKLSECVPELLSQGVGVKLDGLGTFYPSVDGQKLGKDTLAKAVEAGANAMINGIKINFSPENTKGEKLTSRAFKEQCVFEFGYVVESEVRTVDGKERRVQKKTPISYLTAPQADNNGGGGNG